jgi:hypothetical protein
MKVTHVVNKDAVCGYAEYARELDFELRKEFESSIVEPGQDVGDADVVIASYGSTETLGLTPAQTEQWRSQGKKVILLYREAQGDLVENCTIPVKHFLGHVDWIVSHEPTNYGPEYPTEFIPISFVEVPSLPDPESRLVIGSAGFYDPMKHFEDVVELARRTGANVNLSIAHYWRSSLDDVKRNIAEMKKKQVEGDWIELVEWPVATVIRQLARSTINMFWHWPASPCSQSTSVGMAIAAKRPLIISTHRRFRVILEQYADEVYIATTGEDAILIVRQVWEKIQNGQEIRVPDRLYKAFSWTTCGEQYRKLIHKVTGR